MNNILCVIPARGGSKGIPRKNIKCLNGIPLVTYSIRQAVESGIPKHHIVVSSDDPNVLEIARDWNVVAHRRPDELCGDKSSSESALIDALIVDPNCDSVLMLQPTSPIRLQGRIEHAIRVYRGGQYDSLLSTTKMYDFMWYKTTEGQWKSTYDPHNRPMRQDLPIFRNLYFDNGNLYITRKDVLQKKKCRIGDNVCVYPITQIEGIQIDTIEDFETVESILQSSILTLKLSTERSVESNCKGTIM